MQKDIAGQDFRGARQVYAELASGKLNSLQKAKLNALRISMRENERPLATLGGDARFTANEVNKDFKVNVDAMTTGEYVELMRKVASGAVPAPYEADYMFRLAEDIKLPKPIIFSTAKLVLHSYLPYFEKTAADGNSKPAKSDWDSKYLLSQSIMYYAEGVSTVADAETLLKDVNHLNALNKKYTSTDGSRSLIDDIFSMANFREVLSYQKEELTKKGQADVVAILNQIHPEWYRY